MSKHDKKSGKAEAEKEQPSGDYEVGRARPPVHSQFKPGQSGNPKGRPRQNKSFQAYLREALMELMTIKKGNRKMRVPKVIGMIEKQIQNGFNGSTPAFRALAPLILALLEQENQGGTPSSVNEDEWLLMERYLADRFGPGRGPGGAS